MFPAVMYFNTCHIKPGNLENYNKFLTIVITYRMIKFELHCMINMS